MEENKFSDEEAKFGISYGRLNFGFEVDKRTLLEIADLTLGKMKWNPKMGFNVASKEFLLQIRDVEQEVYSAVIGKMFNNRSLVHRLNQRRRAA